MKTKKKLTNRRLRYLYYTLHFSTRKISKVTNISRSTILKLMKYYKIKRRTISDAIRGKYNPGYHKLSRNFIGFLISGDGYRMIFSPKHPQTNNKGYVREHRLIMEKHLGRYLTKKEQIHHKDGNRLNNKISNLILFKSNSEHRIYHAKMFNFLIAKQLTSLFHVYWLKIKKS